MKAFAHIIGLAVVIAVATWVAAWWMVPVLGAAYGVWQASTRAAIWTATVAGALGWAGLLAYDATQGPVGRLSATLGEMVHASRGTFTMLTIAYAALLCASAAAFARAVRRLTLPT